MAKYVALTIAGAITLGAAVMMGAVLALAVQAQSAAEVVIR